jgi:endo-1,4-beta-xylanase
VTNQGLSRRRFLGGIALAACAVPVSALAKKLDIQDKNYDSLPALREIAQRAGALYGAAVAIDELNADDAFAAAVVDECNLIVPENDLKWTALRPDPHTWDFGRADALLAFAKANDMKMRGHTLVWHQAFPQWLRRDLDEDNALSMMQEHIHKVVGRYKGKLIAWDVVNEAIHLKDGREDGLRKTPWLQTLGPSYINSAFTFAAEADPQCKLVYNDYGAEFYGEDSKADAIVALLERLQDNNVPLHGVGIQAHLDAKGSMDQKKLAAFCRRVRVMGLELQITELDVKNQEDTDDKDQFDRLVASKTREFMDIVLAEANPTEILTWGLSDKLTWLDMPDENPYGLEVRPLPLDANNHRKRMWRTLYDTFDHMAQK